MDYYQYLVQKLGEIVLESDQMNYILYPFGHLGALTKGILNGLYGVSEKAIIDNILCDKYDNIKDLSYLDGMEPDGCKVLITSDNINCYEEIRDKLYTVVKKEQCVELFPVPDTITGYRKIKAAIMRKMDDEKVKETYTYHPKKTKSDFYLPLLPTDYIQYTILLTDDYYERSTLETEIMKKHGLTDNGEFQIVEQMTVFPSIVLCGISPYNLRMECNPLYTYAIHHRASSWIEDKQSRNEMIENIKQYSDSKYIKP